MPSDSHLEERDLCPNELSDRDFMEDVHRKGNDGPSRIYEFGAKMSICSPNQRNRKSL